MEWLVLPQFHKDNGEVDLPSSEGKGGSHARPPSSLWKCDGVTIVTLSSTSLKHIRPPRREGSGSMVSPPFFPSGSEMAPRRREDAMSASRSSTSQGERPLQRRVGWRPCYSFLTSLWKYDDPRRRADAMAASFLSPLRKPEGVTMVTLLLFSRRDPPSKKRRVQGHPLLFLSQGKVI